MTSDPVQRPLRILHVIENIARAYGGPSRVLEGLAMRQAYLGHEVALMASGLDYPSGRLPAGRPGEFERHGVRVRLFRTAPSPFDISIAMAAALRGEVGHADIVHIHGIYRMPQVAAAHWAMLAGTPYWMCLHGSLDPWHYERSSISLPMKRLFERIAVRRVLRRADIVHYTTRDERLRACLVDRTQPGVVVPNGIDTELFRPGEPGRFKAASGLAGMRLMTHLGRLTEKKGLDLTIAAFGRLARRHDDLRFVIAGPDNEGFASRIAAWTAEHGVADRVILPGLLSPEESVELLSDSAVFVLASRTENFAVAVVEAMACGTPAVISDRVGVQEAALAADAALVVPCSVDAMEAAIERVLEEPGLAGSLSANGLALARRDYAWESVMTRVIKGYRDTIAARRPRPGT